MHEKCGLAGERIHLRPTADARGLFLQTNGGDRYEQITDGVYRGSGGSILGEPLVNGGLVLFFETINGNRDDQEQFKYRRHVAGDWKGQPTNEAESEFGVFAKDLTTERERKLGIQGTELTVMDLRTTDVLATTIYFVSKRDRRFCGEVTNGTFDAGQFVVRALELRKRYPIASDNPSAGRNR